MSTLLDLSGIRDEEAFHEYVASSLGFPEYYGRNLDALWDCLTDYALSHPDAHLQLVGVRDFREHNSGFADRALQCFTRLASDPFGLKVDCFDGEAS